MYINKNFLSIFATISLIVLFCFIYYHISNDIQNLKEGIQYNFSILEDEIEKLKVNENTNNSNIEEYQCATNKQQAWALLQQKVKDTVVQLFVQTAQFNWIEPYKSPDQSQSLGTAFFINQDGEMLTNAHVVDEAKSIFIQIPSLGKNRFEAEIIGISYERDLALIKLLDHEMEELKQQLEDNKIPYLKFGDSDNVHRAEKIMALGYPLGQQGLKSTTGVVSGRENLGGKSLIQISAPINPGNSGGPSINCKGEVVGINSAGIQAAQNVGYIIPINEAKLFIDQLKSALKNNHTIPILLKNPYFGASFKSGSSYLAKYLKNPEPGGLYIADIYKDSYLYKIGVREGDMIYKINGINVDAYGDMHLKYDLDYKMSLIDYISRLKIGEKVNIEYYRNGVKKTGSFIFDYSNPLPIRMMYPGFEKIDYEVIGGLVVMPLTINHILILNKHIPELIQFADIKKQTQPILIITHILAGSPASKVRSLISGLLITQVNGENVHTLSDFRKALLKSIQTGFLTIKTFDKMLHVIPLEDIIKNEEKLANIFFYNLTQGYKNLKESYDKSNKQNNSKKETNKIK